MCVCGGGGGGGGITILYIFFLYFLSFGMILALNHVNFHFPTMFFFSSCIQFLAMLLMINE